MRISDWSSDVCSSDLGAIARILRIEDAQRVLVEAGEAVLGQITTVRLEMRDQRRAPCLARFGVAQGVELQRHAVGDAEFVEQLIGERQQFDVGGGFGGADDLRIELMELPEARSEERSVGQECVSPCKFRWSPST